MAGPDAHDDPSFTRRSTISPSPCGSSYGRRLAELRSDAADARGPRRPKPRPDDLVRPGSEPQPRHTPPRRASTIGCGSPRRDHLRSCDADVRPRLGGDRRDDAGRLLGLDACITDAPPRPASADAPSACCSSARLCATGGRGPCCRSPPIGRCRRASAGVMGDIVMALPRKLLVGASDRRCSARRWRWRWRSARGPAAQRVGRPARAGHAFRGPKKPVEGGAGVACACRATRTRATPRASPASGLLSLGALIHAGMSLKRAMLASRLQAGCAPPARPGPRPRRSRRPADDGALGLPAATAISTFRSISPSRRSDWRRSIGRARLRHEAVRCPRLCPDPPSARRSGPTAEDAAAPLARVIPPAPGARSRASAHSARPSRPRATGDGAGGAYVLPAVRSC